MYAVVSVGGKQVMMRQGDTVRLDHLKAEEGMNVTFNKVLLVRGEDEIQVGTPLCKGASVECRVLGHERDKKVRVVKYKRRKGYKRTRGHRQGYTRVLVEKVAI